MSSEKSVTEPPAENRYMSERAITARSVRPSAAGWDDLRHPRRSRMGGCIPVYAVSARDCDPPHGHSSRPALVEVGSGDGALGGALRQLREIGRASCRERG